MICIFLVTSFPSFFKKNFIFLGLFYYNFFLHTVHSYLHQDPFAFLLHGTNSSGPYLFHRLLFIYYICMNHSHFMSICYRHFLFFSFVLLVFYFKRTFFLFFTSHKTYQVNDHSPTLPLCNITTVQYKCFLASC